MDHAATPVDLITAKAADDVASPARDHGKSERPAIVGGIQSVRRALGILDAIAFAGGEATLTEVAHRVHLKISTCHNLLSTLVQSGYVAKRRGTRTYVLGSRVLYLSTVCLKEVNLPQRAQRVVDTLNMQTQEAVQVAVLQGDDLVTIMRKETLHAIRIDAGALGKSNAAHATASGKAILAWIPEPELARIIEAKGLTAFTPKTITDFARLVEELRLVRRLGYALDQEEFQLGVSCVGAPIRSPSGTVIGSISVSCPLFRVDQPSLDKIRTLVINAAQTLSSDVAGPHLLTDEPKPVGNDD